MSSPWTRRMVAEASRPLFEELALKPGDDVTVKSRRFGDNGVTYLMTVTPDGYVVHQNEGCEAEAFGLECWHSRDLEKYVTQALAPYQPAAVPSRIDFSTEQLKTITDMICVDGDGNRAPAAFVQLFLAACRHSGLDPFLRQIYALNIKSKWTMFVGIDGYRVISERTGLDEGMDGPQWSDDGEAWYDYPFVDEPKFCRVGIWRKGVPRPYVAVLAMKTRINPNSQSWKQDPAGMLAKCTEAAARRRAFPADMAAIPRDAAFEDAEGAPITSAEVPSGEWREVEAPVMATDEQRKRIARLWDPKHFRIGELRQRWPNAFPQPGAGVNNTRLLTKADADDVLAILSTQPEAPATVTSGAASQGAGDPTPPPVCGHAYAWSDEKAATVCKLCGELFRDEPDAARTQF